MKVYVSQKEVNVGVVEREIDDEINETQERKGEGKEAEIKW